MCSRRDTAVMGSSQLQLGLIGIHFIKELGMLVLSRKLGEEIRIGDNVTVTVVRVRNNKIRLGISAPRQIPIFRTEVLNRVDAAGAESSQLACRQPEADQVPGLSCAASATTSSSHERTQI